jgi:hypothetical protein
MRGSVVTDAIWARINGQSAVGPRLLQAHKKSFAFSQNHAFSGQFSPWLGICRVNGPPLNQADLTGHLCGHESPFFSAAMFRQVIGRREFKRPAPSAHASVTTRWALCRPAG